MHEVQEVWGIVGALQAGGGLDDLENDLLRRHVLVGDGPGDQLVGGDPDSPDIALLVSRGGLDGLIVRMAENVTSGAIQ